MTAIATSPDTGLLPDSGLGGLYLRLICVPAIWGGTFVAGRIVSAQLPPATAAFARYVLASLALLAVLQFSQGLGVLRRITLRQLLGTLGLGATGILTYNLLFFSALSFLPAGRTALIVALNPVVTLLLAAALLGDRLPPSRWGGMALALLGVWVVVTHGDLGQLRQSLGRGELSMLGAVLAWAAYTLLGRRVLRDLSPLVATLLASLWGTLFLGVAALPEWPLVHWQAFTPAVGLSLLFLGVIGTAVAFVWYYEGITRLGAARTVIFNNLVPVFSVLFGWLMLGEPISASLLAGGALAVAGVFLVNRAGR
ncbi:MAG: DMT family transporter [Curvibacter sp.]|nr:DMT family transporter [Curvibacter sp.]